MLWINYLKNIYDLSLYMVYSMHQKVQNRSFFPISINLMRFQYSHTMPFKALQITNTIFFSFERISKQIFTEAEVQYIRRLYTQYRIILFSLFPTQVNSFLHPHKTEQATVYHPLSEREYNPIKTIHIAITNMYRFGTTLGSLGF